MADLANEEKPAIAPPVFVFQKNEKGQKEKIEPMTSPTPPSNKRPVDASNPEDAEDSDRDDGNYPPPVKRERSSSFTQVFPPSQPDEKNIGFRLKPPTLIHGQAPSAGLPSQKSKEQQRSVLRPAVLQPPQQKSFAQNVNSSGTNGVSKPTEEGTMASSINLNSTSDKETPSINSSTTTISHTIVEGSDISGDMKESSMDGEALPATNYFLQYIKQNTTNLLDSGENAESNAKSAKFVFGENMSERVLSLPRPGDVCSESSSDQLFGENAATPSGSASEPLQETTPEKVNNVTESLEESAAAYTKATAKKCLLKKVEVITGEEAESNVLQIQCKLFVFDKTSQSWVERGRGLLRLNDMASGDDGALQSRLVMRTQGSLRLILNTKLWAQMQIDKASEKSIRITAMDAEDQGVKVFLISASSKDAGQLYAALHHRILALRSRSEQEPEPPCITSESGVTQSNEEDSDDDDGVIVPATTTSGPCDTDDKQTTGST
ncbi:ran-binding protein 3b isoform X6 [Pristis pectinata]|uniref:ran-binding protein 3b isoform X6 n=1 Tax=Pristis pectinata TaxID=685728 RepID=UPI00223CE40E|nr:ran-binding protein 3b isoform X6 [Pristis pectinata]